MTEPGRLLEEHNRKLLMDRSEPGRVGVSFTKLDVPESDLPDDTLLRKELDMPEVSESEIVRYFSQLSHYNFSIDHNFYPLGSCTMKYNPKVNDEMAAHPGMSEIHPYQPESTVQGALKLIWRLQEILTELMGMAGASVSLKAGAESEFAGMLMARAYHLARGDTRRKKVLIPDSAHGTNPASAVVAGFHVVSLPTNEEGDTDLGALQAAVGDDLAGFMLTQPSTLGIFDTNLPEVIQIVRRAGGIMYGDGANLNALLGKVKLGELGFDVVHSNLHKTFTQPHGGGGPGAGAVMVSERLLPFLPEPHVARTESRGGERFTLVSPPQSIGRLGPFQGTTSSASEADAGGGSVLSV